MFRNYFHYSCFSFYRLTVLLVIWKVKRRLTFQSSCICRLRCFPLDSCLDVYLYILFDIQRIYKAHLLLKWELVASDSRYCYLLEAHGIEDRRGWPTASSQLRCGSGLWVEAAEKTNSHWPELQLHGRVLEKLPGLCCCHRLHSPVPLTGEFKGFHPQHTSLQVPLSSSTVGLLWAPGIGSGALILLAQTVCSVARQQLVFLSVCHERPVTVAVCHDNLPAEILVPQLSSLMFRKSFKCIVF